MADDAGTYTVSVGSQPSSLGDAVAFDLEALR